MNPVKKVWIKFISSSYVGSTQAHLTPQYLAVQLDLMQHTKYKKYCSMQVVTCFVILPLQKKLLTIAQPVGHGIQISMSFLKYSYIKSFQNVQGRLTSQCHCAMTLVVFFSITLKLCYENLPQNYDSFEASKWHQQSSQQYCIVYFSDSKNKQYYSRIVNTNKNLEKNYFIAFLAISDNSKHFLRIPIFGPKKAAHYGNLG